MRDIQTGGKHPRVAAAAALACALAAALALPFAPAALAADSAAGGTRLGLRVWDSSKGSDESGGAGSTRIGIRVTDSSNPTPLAVTVAFDSCGGSHVASQTVPYDTAVAEPSAPSRNGYSFLGWFDAPSGGSKHDFSLPVRGGTTLYAQWALRIECSVPASAVVTIDASGAVRGCELPFSSSTVAPLVVSTVTVVELLEESSVFPDPATRDGVRIVLTAPSRPPAELPLALGGSARTDFPIPEKSSLSVDFSLSVPRGAAVGYSEAERNVARLGYVIEAAS